ncbi:MAG: hypothetical protein DRQ06_01105 [Candidatus Hydrothermota bacterium]|nr:MAG: hypothetical protein DRQ06_01105 [Candidatus Hydrothermae bacterium]
MERREKEALISEIKNILERPVSREEKLRDIAELLRNRVEHYDWVGFYLVEEDETLVLGPYSGEPTEHVRIRFGKGICGQAAALRRPFLVEDVSKENNYLSCSPLVKSELVVPIFKKSELVGELDIDSHRLAAFDESDLKFLQQVCKIVSDALF